MKKVDSSIGAAAQMMLQVPQLPALEALLTTVINDISTINTPFLLILDDYHAINAPAIQAALIFLIENLPPVMHVVITSRSDPPLPLARWRVRRDLVEVRVRELRFTSEEAAQFLRQEVKVELTAAELAALEQRTEGWIAGLQLAGLSLTEHTDVQEFIQAFTGNHAYIVDYLVEEVLQRQPAAIWHFLLQTAILERLSAPLCDAVLQQTNSQAMLEQRERANLFLVPLDNERRWYRYHHLFAEVLRNRLKAQPLAAVAATHQRASDWYAEHNSPIEAVTHSFAAGDQARVAGLIEQYAEMMLNRDERFTLQNWLDRLPELSVRKHPWLCLARGLMFYDSHQMEAAEEYLQAAELAMQANAPGTLDPGLVSEVAAARLGITLYRKDLPTTIALAQQVLAMIPPDKSRVRAHTMMRLGLAYNWHGELAKADTAYAEATRLGQAASDVYTAVLAKSNQAGIRYERGELRQAAALDQQAIDLAGVMGAPQAPIVGSVQQSLAEYYYEWDELETAARLVQAAFTRLRHAGNPRLMLLSYVTLTRILNAQGDVTGALEALQQAEKLVRDHSLPIRYTSPVMALRLQQWLAQGNHKAATDWLQSSGLQVDAAITAGEEGQSQAVARVLLAQGEFDAALHWLVRLRQSAEALGRQVHVIRMLALQSVALSLKGDKAAALATLAHGLQLAEPQGYIRTFVDEGEPMRDLIAEYAIRNAESSRRTYVAKLLSSFGFVEAKPITGPITEVSPHSTLPTPNSALIEPLTERELEVLRLVAQGLSDRQIAEQLIVVIGTVKRHLNNLYGKLGVHSRTQALVQARALGLL